MSSSDRWELGGEFHWMGLPQGPFIAWPGPARWYLLGRHTIVALLRALPPRNRRLWVPDYFCFDVSDFWKNYGEVVTYADDPRSQEPVWSTLRPSADDLVIAVNYFGVRSGNTWRDWREQNDCVLVEDHSHDPLSGWSLNSTADYAFASLRKTIPVPDGAILWSPRGLTLPSGGIRESEASALKLAAMLWKRDYLDGLSSVEAKGVYRAWQEEGEKSFERSDVSFATCLSQEYLSFGFPVHWREQRVENTRRLLFLLGRHTEMRPLFSDWSAEAAPLGAVFEFDSQAQRDRMRHKFRESRVYCPIHWPPTGDCSPAARDLAARLLTIPTDQRYGASEMEKIASFVTI